MARPRGSFAFFAILAIGAFEGLGLNAEASLLLRNPTVQPVKDPQIQYEVTAVLGGFDQSNNPCRGFDRKR